MERRKMNRAEFQRDQITRKSVFVRNTKRMAPAPPSADEVDGVTPKISLKTMGIQGNGTTGTSNTSSTSNKVATENKINLCKTQYMTTTEQRRPHFTPQRPSIRNKGTEKWDNISQDNRLHIQEHDTPVPSKQSSAIRPSTLSTTTPEDDTSMNMLLQLEKQINRIEFDTRVTHSEAPSPTTPVVPMARKPIQYTGMESLLNTGVSNVATEGGIGYLEINANTEEPNTTDNFKRNTDVRQSVGHGTTERKHLLPTGVKQCRPVQRTASDTNQIKAIAMQKRNTDKVVTDGKKISPLPPTRTTASLMTANSGGKLKAPLSRDDKVRPTDVRKFVEEHMKSRKVNTPLTPFCLKLGRFD